MHLVKFRASKGATRYAVNPLLVSLVAETEEPDACVLRFAGEEHIIVPGATTKSFRRLLEHGARDRRG